MGLSFFGGHHGYRFSGWMFKPLPLFFCWGVPPKNGTPAWPHDSFCDTKLRLTPIPERAHGVTEGARCYRRRKPRNPFASNCPLRNNRRNNTHKKEEAKTKKQPKHHQTQLVNPSPPPCKSKKKKQANKQENSFPTRCNSKSPVGLTLWIPSILKEVQSRKPTMWIAIICWVRILGSRN